MRFVEVAGVSTRVTAFFWDMCLTVHSLSLAGVPLRLPSFGRRCAPTLQLPWDYLVHPGIRFGRVVMCFVEVAGVSTRLSLFLLHSLPLSRMPLRRP